MTRFALPIACALLASHAPAADPTPDAAKKRVVGILIFDAVEALDFCGP